jgi:hypothetical protein
VALAVGRNEDQASPAVMFKLKWGIGSVYLHLNCRFFQITAVNVSCEFPFGPHLDAAQPIPTYSCSQSPASCEILPGDRAIILINRCHSDDKQLIAFLDR